MKKKTVCILLVLVLAFAAINAASADSYTNSEWGSFPTAELNDAGYRVRLIQNILLGHSFSTYTQIISHNGADGSFGPGTEDAVRTFQGDHGLSPVDGKVGYNTWRALGSEIVYKNTSSGTRYYKVKNNYATGSYKVLVRRLSSATWEFRKTESNSWHQISN